MKRLISSAKKKKSVTEKSLFNFTTQKTVHKMLVKLTPVLHLRPAATIVLLKRLRLNFVPQFLFPTLKGFSSGRYLASRPFSNEAVH